MRKFTKLTTTLLAACASLLLCTADVNAASGWVLNNGSWYYYGITTGIMQTGNLTDNGHLYYLRSGYRYSTPS